MRRTARLGDGWLPYLYTPEPLARSLETIREHAGEAGRDPSAIRAGVFLWSAVHEDGRRAREMAVQMLSRNYNQDFSALAERYVVAGDPARCRARILEYIDAGASLVLLPPALAAPDAAASVALMAADVIAPLRHAARDHPGDDTR